MIFFGHVSPGGHPELLSDLLKGRLANCRVQLDIDGKKTPPSLQQSAYLFAAVYPPIAEHMGYAVTECHEICKKLFLAPRQLTVGDRTVVVAGSTTRLTTSEMAEYIDRVISLAHELGCTVMTPSEAGCISNTAAPVTGYDRD